MVGLSQWDTGTQVKSQPVFCTHSSPSRNVGWNENLWYVEIHFFLHNFFFSFGLSTYSQHALADYNEKNGARQISWGRDKTVWYDGKNLSRPPQKPLFDSQKKNLAAHLVSLDPIESDTNEKNGARQIFWGARQNRMISYHTIPYQTKPYQVVFQISPPTHPPGIVLSGHFQIS